MGGEHPTLGDAKELVMLYVKEYRSVSSAEELVDHMRADEINVYTSLIKMALISLFGSGMLKYNYSSDIVLGEQKDM